MKQKQFYPFQFDTANKWLAVSFGIASFFLLIYELKTVFTSPIALQKLTLSPAKDIVPVKIAKDSALFKNSLFGEYVPIARGAMNLPLLDIEVMGILYADQGKTSQVILKIGSEERIFSVGDSVPGGALIKKIQRNTVTVLYNGVLRSVALAKPALTFNVPPAPLIEG